ncbi:MAG: DsbA family protein, partial [Pseudomonadota bacterium]
AVSMQGIKNKPEYGQIETQRYLQRYNVQPYVFNPNFPVNTLMMMRGAAYLLDTDTFSSYVDGMFACMWQDALKMDDPEVFAQALATHGLPKDEILAAIADPEVKQKLVDSTSHAVDRGAFGSPTFFVGDEIYFGKEKLRDIEDLVANG